MKKNTECSTIIIKLAKLQQFKLVTSEELR